MTDAILTRRAVRKFTDEKLSDAEINQLIASFNAAPCGMHKTEVMQGTVVKDEALLQQIEDATNNSCYGAPLLFIISTKKGSPFGERDASVAAENIMIEANSIGLGSVYIMGGAINLDKNTELKKQLEISDSYSIQVIIPVGYMAQEPAKEDRSNRYQVTIK